ncbi:MAG: hypothetical protein J6S91_10945 [Treponema sp.]|nr:hypothetical protein [Treponema sp.]
MRIKHSSRTAMCFCLAMAMTSTCCASNDKSKTDANKLKETQLTDALDCDENCEVEAPDLIATKGKPGQKNRPSISDKTVLVTLKDSCTNEDVYSLAKDFNLDVKYIYSFGKTCALSSKVSLSEKEIYNLIALLKADSRVVNAEPDNIIYLDDREWKGFNTPEIM